MAEEKKRSLMKAITWRITMLLNSFLIMLIFVKDVKTSIVYALVLNAVAMTLYYIHERIWNRVNWGRS